MALIRRVFIDWNGPSVKGLARSTLYFSGALSASVVRARIESALTSEPSAFHSSLNWSVDRETQTIEDSTGQVQGVNFDSVVRDGSGTGAGSPVASATQGRLLFRTGTYLNGRELRGMIYLPGASNTNLDAEGSISVAQRGRYQNIGDTLQGTAGLRVFSPTHLTSSEVTTVEVPIAFSVLTSRRD